MHKALLLKINNYDHHCSYSIIYFMLSLLAIYRSSEKLKKNKKMMTMMKNCTSLEEKQIKWLTFNLL